jgi:hypothetical protein
MSKRPSVDLLALTSEPATPMPEAVQRIPRTSTATTATRPARPEAVKTENLHGLAFKVPPAFRKRFRQRAANADLKLNELLFEALAAWEEKHGIKA